MHKRRNCKQKEGELKVRAATRCSGKTELNLLHLAIAVQVCFHKKWHPFQKKMEKKRW